MKKILLSALIGGALVSPLSAALTLVDFSQATTWNASNPDASTFSPGDAPMTFQDVLGIPGCTVTVAFSGIYLPQNGTDVFLDGADFDNRVDEGTNTWTVTFGSVVNFRIDQRTHHGPDETNTLTVGGGTFDNASFLVRNDNTGGVGNPPTGSLSAAFSGADTAVSIGPYSAASPNTGGHHPEWTIDGTGTSFTFTQDTTVSGDGSANQAHRNQFRFSIEDTTHVIPEPSHTLLLGLGSLALLARRRK